MVRRPIPGLPGNRRYVEGQQLYLKSCTPSLHATVTIDNNDLAMPFFVQAPA